MCTAMVVSNRFEVLGTLEGLVECEIPVNVKRSKLPRSALKNIQRYMSGVPSSENIEESHAARLDGDSDRYKTLSRKTRAVLRRDKEGYVRGLAQDVESGLPASELRPAFLALKKLRSKSRSKVSTIRTAAALHGRAPKWTALSGRGSDGGG